MMEEPEDPFSREETEAAEWAALKVTPWSGSFFASPQPDVEPLPEWNPDAVMGKLTQKDVDEALKRLWRGTIFRGPEADL